VAAPEPPPGVVEGEPPAGAEQPVAVHEVAGELTSIRRVHGGEFTVPARGVESGAMSSMVLQAFLEQLRATKRMGDRAFAQLADEDFFFRLSPRQNSIRVIVKHLAGNMHSRWTDFLTADGEKPDRDRESEFVEDLVPHEQILREWESGWASVFEALEPLTDEDVGRTVRIRGEPLSVARAIVRQIEHYGYHVGQIALLAKHVRGERWKYLTIPPGDSGAFNRAKGHA
jgi:hypothetical protein